MKLYKITLACLFLSLIACNKQEPCIDTGWYDRNLTNSEVHQEWSGEIKIQADSIAIQLIVDNKEVFFDTMYNETRSFSIEKQQDYRVNTYLLDSVQSYELDIQQRYEDCSNL